MNSGVRQTIQTITTSTVALVMLMALGAYLITGFVGAPIGPLLRVSLAALVVNLLGVIWLANAGIEQSLARRLTGLFLGGYLVVAAGLGAFVAGIQTMPQFVSLAVSTVLGALFGLLAIGTDRTSRWAQFGLIAIILSFSGYGFVTQHPGLAFQTYQRAFGVAALFGALGFLPIVRRQLSRWLSLDPEAPTTVTAIVLGALGLGFAAESFGLFNLLRPLATSLGNELVSPTWVVGQLVVMVLTAFLAVGWLSRRTLRQATDRLGLKELSWRSLGPVILTVVAMFLINGLGGWLSSRVGAGATDDTTTRALLSQFHSPVLMLLLASSAGIGEELLFRGALQPRFGLVFTSLIFTLAHVQYVWTGLLTVFCLGLVLGFVRQRTNTTVSILAHVLYDGLGLALLLASTNHP